MRLFGKAKGISHEEGMAKLAALNSDLEAKAATDYSENKDKILDCPNCKIQPNHTYDSFGMPMHKLECPNCGLMAEYAKMFKGVVEYWNDNVLFLRKKKAGKIQRCARCGQELEFKDIVNYMAVKKGWFYGITHNCYIEAKNIDWLIRKWNKGGLGYEKE